MGQVRPSHMFVHTDLLSRRVLGLACCKTPFKCAVPAGCCSYAWTLCSMLDTKSISLSLTFAAAVMTESAQNVLDRIYSPGSWQQSLNYSHVNPVLSCNSKNQVLACGADLDSGKTTVLAGGHDFVAAPRLSPDGSQLAWVAWDHPNMPWDDSMLYVAQVATDGSLSSTRKVNC